MARNDTTALNVSTREPDGSRSARRLRRAGNVPGVVYGGGDEPLAFQIPARELRHVLAGAGAVLDLAVGGAKASPVVIKELVRHPITGDTVHIDLLRVRLDVKIQATVVLELTGAEDSPGAKDGGVLEQITRELTIEALPTDIPDSLTHDVSTMEINDTITLEALTPPATVTLVDDPETVIATLTPPRLQLEAEDEIESETEVVGEGEEGEAGEEGESAAEGGDADASGDSDAE
ncbi:MAG TPA: 50S ribosomal protein L25 [Solirubrobacteraceae bacterium]|nr:50S ribosomal protein L25 [Solirubrobacteraceae bacterium]